MGWRIVVVAVLGEAVLATTLPALAGTGGGTAPRGDTITRVTGTARDGFTVHRYDGRVLHLPTLSEATAECTEYRRRGRRIRCDAHIRTWYRDLGDTKRALRYAYRR